MYYKNKFCSNSYPKSDVSTQTDFSDELDRLNKQDKSSKHDSSNKQVRSRKQARSSIQGSSSKQDCPNNQNSSINYIIDADPDLLCDKLREILEKPVKTVSDNMMSEMIVDELLRVEAITEGQYNGMCRNLVFLIKFIGPKTVLWHVLLKHSV